MEFDKSRVYTALNADEVKLGSKVFVADNLTALKQKVEENALEDLFILDKVLSENYSYRFEVEGIDFILCYLVSEWDEKDEETTYYCFLDRDIDRFMFDHEKPSSHIYAEFTDRYLANSWCKTHDKFAEIAKAWEDGKTIQVYSPSLEKWIDCTYHDLIWDLNTKYRVKPDEEIYDVYITTCFQHTPEFMVFKHSMAVHRGGICYYEGTKSECENWIESHKKFKDLMYAWEYEDKTIQYYNSEKEWHDCPNDNPSWDLNTKYRVKPDEPVEVETSERKMYIANGAEIPKKRRMTNRELAKWLAQGNGQCMFTTNAVGTAYSYGIFDGKEIPDGIKIRGWNEEEWREPVIEEESE